MREDVPWGTPGTLARNIQHHSATVDDGSFRQDWKLANLHQDPEFIALMDELEADILKQRQW